VNFLKLNGTDDIPEVMIDSDLSVFIIRGNSTPEDAISVYKPIVDWLSDKDCQLDNCRCEFFFRYLSSASHHFVFDILRQLDFMYIRGHQLSIIWKYEEIDEDMLRLGMDFSSILQIHFDFQAIK